MTAQAFDNAGQRELIGTANFTKGGLAINAASAATVKTTATVTYSIGGVLYSKAALSAQSIAVTHGANGLPVAAANGNPAYVQPINSTVIYLVGLDAAGNVSLTQGAYAGQVMSFNGNLAKRVTDVDGGVPTPPANVAVIGAFKVVTNGSATFTPGSTALDAAGVSVTYYDLQVLPAAL